MPASLPLVYVHSPLVTSRDRARDRLLPRNFDFLLMLADPEEQGGAIKETIHDVGIPLDPVIDHFVAVHAMNDQSGKLAMFSQGTHNDVRFHTVIENPDWTNRRVVVATLDLI